MSSSFTLEGVDNVVSNLRLLSSNLHDQAMRSLLTEANDILTDSRDNYVPFDKGTLHDDSGVTESDDDELSVTIYYGADAASSYALSVHETPSDHDPWSWRGTDVKFVHGGSKYLERPLMNAVDGMADRLAERIKLDE